MHPTLKHIKVVSEMYTYIHIIYMGELEIFFSI